MEKQISDLSIVALGGGTGLSTILRGLKKHCRNITAIVTMADDGGGSGQLRNELGMPPPGDVRSCLEALANTEPTLQKLLRYRFTEGGLKGQSLGNLFLAALNDISGSFYGAVQSLSEVFAITGRVLPVTSEDVHLLAHFDDGTEILGESKIRTFKKEGDRRIEKISLVPASPAALGDSIRAIEAADIILLGPGSLYTSIIPNLLTEGVSDAIAKSKAFRVYILNVSTEDGETDNFTASDHLKVLFDHSGGRIVDYCLANAEPFPDFVEQNHRSRGGGQTILDPKEIEALGVTTIARPVLEYGDGFGHHDPDKLANELFELYRSQNN